MTPQRRCTRADLVNININDRRASLAVAAPNASHSPRGAPAKLRMGTALLQDRAFKFLSA